MTPREPYIDKIDNDTTSKLPAIEFRGDIRIVDREEQVEEACRYLAEQPILGFDTETRPSFRAGVTFRVSLLQLSSPERCYLFRLNRIALSKPILQLLENAGLPKIGADVAGDLRSLHQLRHFREAGFIDLQAIVGAWGIEEKSLRKMSAIVLGKRVSKAQRLSNWESSELTDKQRIYAATDAWVCIQIYRRLQSVPQTHTLEAPAPSEEQPAPKRKRSHRGAGRSRRSGPAPTAEAETAAVSAGPATPSTDTAQRPRRAKADTVTDGHAGEGAPKPKRRRPRHSAKKTADTARTTVEADRSSDSK